MKTILIAVISFLTINLAHAETQLSCKPLGKDAPDILIVYKSNFHTQGPVMEIISRDGTVTALTNVYYSEENPQEISISGTTREEMYARHHISVSFVIGSPTSIYKGQYRTGWGWCGTGDLIYDVECVEIPQCI